MVAPSSFLSQLPTTIIANAKATYAATDLKIINVMSRWYVHLLTLPISARVSEGIAQLAGFDVLRHGTSFTNYLSILKNGGDPALGGSKKGSSVAVGGAWGLLYKMQSEGYFYVFKDSALNPFDRIYTKILPRLHAVLSGATTANNFISKLLPHNMTTSLVKKITGIFFGALNFFSPTVRFMYRADEIRANTPVKFTNDSLYEGLAYRTKQLLPNDRIGLIGLLKHIQFSDITKTVKQCPLCSIAGAVQVVAGIIFTNAGIGFIF